MLFLLFHFSFISKHESLPSFRLPHLTNSHCSELQQVIFNHSNQMSWPLVLRSLSNFSPREGRRGVSSNKVHSWLTYCLSKVGLFNFVLRKLNPRSVWKSSCTLPWRVSWGSLTFYLLSSFPETPFYRFSLTCTWHYCMLVLVPG